MEVLPITTIVLNVLLGFLVMSFFFVVAAIVFLFQEILDKDSLKKEKNNDLISKERLTRDMLDELYKAIEEIDYSKLDTSPRLTNEMLQNVGALVGTLSKCKKRMR